MPLSWRSSTPTCLTPNTKARRSLTQRERVCQRHSVTSQKTRIKFSWVKAHAGTLGNEIADRLAQVAARCGGTEHVFARIPKSTIYQEAREVARQKWQREWTRSQKAAATRQYFPTVQARLRSKIKLTPKITVVLTGHGMTKAYLQRFHLSEEATCRCGNEYQSMDHILFHCANISAQREV